MSSQLGLIRVVVLNLMLMSFFPGLLELFFPPTWLCNDDTE